MEVDCLIRVCLLHIGVLFFLATLVDIAETMELTHPSGTMDPLHPNTTVDPPPYNPSCNFCQQLYNYMLFHHGSTLWLHLITHLEGPPEMCTWATILKFDQLEIGHGAASTRAEALNEACKEALDYLST
ncbi:hypothetical protein V8B97DRAFT_1920240 [Scleroderma yunnanense]